MKTVVSIEPHNLFFIWGKFFFDLVSHDFENQRSIRDYCEFDHVNREFSKISDLRIMNATNLDQSIDDVPHSQDSSTEETPLFRIGRQSVFDENGERRGGRGSGTG